MDKKELKTVDFDIHGLVGIRLIDATEKECAGVHKQIGLAPGKLSGQPDIIVRFVPYLDIQNLKYLGSKVSGFNQEEFFILWSGKRPVKAIIPFDQIGNQCEIVCERGLKAVPLLIAILNMTLLARGYVSLHASAFTFNGAGILVTGWAKGGKTEALLAFARHGAEYIGDEWIILNREGDRMYGLPEPIRIWQWHLQNLPEIKAELDLSDKAVFKAINSLDRFQAMMPNGKSRGVMPIKILREAMPALRRQLNIRMKPEELFGNRPDSLCARPDRLFLVVGHEGEGFEINSIDPMQIAERMISSLEYEAIPFMSHYYAFKFAFPQRRNELIEQAAVLQSELLRSALQEKDAFLVLHPARFSFENLYEVMRPYCGPSAKMSVTVHGETI